MDEYNLSEPGEEFQEEPDDDPVLPEWERDPPDDDIEDDWEPDDDHDYDPPEDQFLDSMWEDRFEQGF